jgi:predicted RNA binding protein YcfA (HicA-like mRNA interferase family)
VKVREAIKLLEDDGWSQSGQRGSHRYFEHPVKAGKVTIAGRGSADLHPKTRNAILAQAGLR